MTIHTTYVLVATRVEASLFATRGSDNPPELIWRVEHPEGRLKASDIDSDRPGRSFDRHGASRHALSLEESPVDHVAHTFAIRLAKDLEHARQQNAFGHLVLVAGPRLLGLLRAALSKQTRALVVAEIDKDLPQVTPRVVHDQLVEHMRRW